MNSVKLLNMFGFAQKSGNLISGFDAVSRHMQKRKVKLVIISTDIANNSLEKIIKNCQANNVKYHQVLTTEEISRSIGKTNRSIIGILNKGFANSINTEITND